MKSRPKVAIIHDWLVGGGAELVVYELHKMFPEAPIYTSYCNKEWRRRLDNKVVTGYLQRWPFSKLYKFLPVLRGLWFSRLKLSGYELVISSSGNGEAKYIKVPASTVHICYCHSPTHFYWRHHKEYIMHPKSGVLNPIARLGLRMLIKPLRRWDYRAAQRPDFFIANSSHIQGDIKKFYGRDSVVVHPPVNTQRFTSQGTAPRQPRTGFITVGRQVPYKKVDLIVDACTRLNLPLTIIGKGPEHNKLERRAGKTITFIDNASDTEVVEHMQNAKAFILAAFEDFGITPVEAMAAGTPVIAYKAGGALDYVIPGQTGEFFSEQTTESLMACLKGFDSRRYSPTVLNAKAEEFSVERFHRNIKGIISSLLDKA